MAAANEPPPPRAVAQGAANALGAGKPADDHGLGSVGEAFVRKLIDDTDNDHEIRRKYVLFSPQWRDLIHWFDDAKLKRLKRIVETLDDDEIEVLAAAIEDYAERQTMRRVWKRVWGALLVVVPACFAVAQYGISKLPLIRDVFKLVAGG